MSFGSQPRVPPEPPGDDAHLRQAGDVVAVVAGHHLPLGRRALGGRGDHRRWLAQVSGAFGAGDNQGDPAVALLTTVQQPQHRRDDPARVLVVLQGDGTLVEPGIGIAGRVRAVHDGDPPEVLVGDPVRRHVALGMHRDPRRGGEQSERGVVRHERRSPQVAAAAAAEAHAGALVERPPAHHDVGHPGRDGHRRVHHGAGRRAAAVRHAGEEVQVADAHVAGDFDLVAGVHGEGDHAVDVAGGQPGVVERGTDCLAGQLEFAAAGLLGELGLPDAGYGAAAGQRAHASQPRRAGSGPRCPRRGRPGCSMP